jgi:hypothetical protein
MCDAVHAGILIMILISIGLPPSGLVHVEVGISLLLFATDVWLTHPAVNQTLSANRKSRLMPPVVPPMEGVVRYL